MKILLLGEYSNLHHTLANALKDLGHRVTLVSDGDGWKNYPRDIDLRRKWHNPLGSALYALQLLAILPKLRGYDIVQLINPIFIDMKPAWNAKVFDYLKKHNKHITLGLFGDDYYCIKHTIDDSVVQYSDLFANGKRVINAQNNQRLADWLRPNRISLNKKIASEADALIACLYEYYVNYKAEDNLAQKVFYAPLPILCEKPTAMNVAAIMDRVPIMSKNSEVDNPDVNQMTTNVSEDSEFGIAIKGKSFSPNQKVKILVGIQKLRSLIKGINLMLPLLDKLEQEYPDCIEVTKVESVPFAQYQQMLRETDVLVDQIYSYTPAMNALEAMKSGTIVISGGEEEAYAFINEHRLRPIINLRPGETEANYTTLKEILLDPQRLQKMSQDSIRYVFKHNEAHLVAKRYLEIWQGLHS